MEKKTMEASFSETKPCEWFLMLKDVSFRSGAEGESPLLLTMLSTGCRGAAGLALCSISSHLALLLPFPLRNGTVGPQRGWKVPEVYERDVLWPTASPVPLT